MAAHISEAGRIDPWGGASSSICSHLARPGGAGRAAASRRSPSFQAPFTLANPNERWPILVKQGEATLDLAVNRGSAGLTPTANVAAPRLPRDYRQPDGRAALVKRSFRRRQRDRRLRAVHDCARRMRQAGMTPAHRGVGALFRQLGPVRAVALSYLRTVAKAPIARTGRRTSRAIRRTCPGPIWAAPPSATSPFRSTIRTTSSSRATRRRARASAAT